jgi:hypothetical protein
MIWVNTKPCITQVEGIYAYMNIYAYLCICDSLIIVTRTGKYAVKKKCGEACTEWNYNITEGKNVLHKLTNKPSP